MFNNPMNWWKRRRLRIAREKYAYWKARAEAYERIPRHAMEPWLDCCGRAAKYEERVESLMREQ